MNEGRSPLTWLGGLLALYLLVPIGYFLYRFAGSHQRGFAAPGLGPAFVTSAETATVTTAIVAVLGVPLAYWLGRSDGAVASTVGVLVQLPLALPPVMSGILLIYLVGPYTSLGSHFALTDSLAGIVLAQTFVAAPFLIIAARSAFRTIDQSLLDTAATSGHRAIGRFRLVALPMAAAGIRAGLLLTWLRALGEYGATVLLAYHPYTLPVFTSLQFAATGLPTTQAPTALALALAALGLVLNSLRLPRHTRTPRLPAPVPPTPQPPASLSFDLDTGVGDFRLHLTHCGTSNRLAILGPSGSGKSVTLRALAGLLGPDAGTVRIDGRDVGREPPHRRALGYVPQSHGLLPHRTVWRNACFAVDADPARAAWWLRVLHLDGLEARRPGQLSGGQRQRAALAAAMARQPRIVLLDEPFSALDTPVRHELRRELRRLHRETGLSTVLVTHDPDEAALLADDIIVIDDGRLLQAGTRREVFGRPASPEVARLLGIENVLDGVVAADRGVQSGGLRLAVDVGTSAVGEPVHWCVRPEHVHLDTGGDIDAVVEDVADLGTVYAVTVRVPDGPCLELRSHDGRLETATTCRIRIDTEQVTVWPAPADG